MTRAPAASAIVVTRDGPPTLGAALRSLAAQTACDLECVLVLNGLARPHLGALVPETFAARLKVVELDRNRGFAGGVNAGMAVARGRHLVLLNDDAEASPRFVAELVAAVERHAGAGMAAPKVLAAEPAGTIDTAGHLLFPDGLNRGRGHGEPDRGQHDRRRDALYPSGAAALYRRVMLEEIGPFDERFFAYGEDTDLGLRGRLAGWRCLYVPTATARHVGSLTAGATSAFKAYHVERNRVWVAVKHFPLELLLLNPCFALLRWIVQAAGVPAGLGKAAAMRRDGGVGVAGMARLVLASQRAALAGLPAMWRERRRPAAVRRLGRRSVYRWLVRDGVSVRTIALGS